MPQALIARGELAGDNHSALDWSKMYAQELEKHADIALESICTNGSNTFILVGRYGSKRLVLGTVFTRRNQLTITLNEDLADLKEHAVNWLRSVSSSAPEILGPRRGALRYLQPLCDDVVSQLKILIADSRADFTAQPAAGVKEAAALYDRDRLEPVRFVRGRVRRILLCSSDPRAQQQKAAVYVIMAERIARKEVLAVTYSIAHSEELAKAWAVQLNLAYDESVDTCLCVTPELSWL